MGGGRRVTDGKADVRTLNVLAEQGLCRPVCDLPPDARARPGRLFDRVNQGVDGGFARGGRPIRQRSEGDQANRQADQRRQRQTKAGSLVIRAPSRCDTARPPLDSLPALPLLKDGRVSKFP